MDAEQLRAWLLQQPRPTRVVVVDANADPHELEIKPGTTWKAVAETLLALGPVKYELFDGTKLLRAKTNTPDGEEETEDDDELVVADPESQRLIVFARLLAEGYRHANGVAFQTLSEICRSQTERAQALEGALRTTEEIMMKQMIAQARAAAQEDGDDVLGGLVRGMVKGAVEKDANSNGSLHVDPTTGKAIR